MKRRTLLKGLLTGPLSSAAPRVAARPGIIDAHVHFYDPSRPQGVPWPSSKTDALYRPTLPGPWAALVRPLGVAGVIVVEASPWLEDNQWVLDLAKENSIIAGTVGHLDPGNPEFRGQLARFARNPLFRGIRLGEKPLQAVLSGSASLDNLKRLADADLALDVLGTGAMLFDVAKLSGRIPHLRIVIDHLPFAAPPGALNALRGFMSVYAKVSGVLRRVDGRVPENANFYRGQLDELWDIFGPERLIYASNWPVSELVAPYSIVLAVVREYFEAKSATDAEKYFRLNSASAYKWVSRT